jgi:hypothetical protein
MPASCVSKQHDLRQESTRVSDYVLTGTVGEIVRVCEQFEWSMLDAGKLVLLGSFFVTEFIRWLESVESMTFLPTIFRQNLS